MIGLGNILTLNKIKICITLFRFIFYVFKLKFFVRLKLRKVIEKDCYCFFIDSQISKMDCLEESLLAILDGITDEV